MNSSQVNHCLWVPVLPAMSLIPPVVIVAVYVVEYNRGCDGTNVANGVPGLGSTVPETAKPLPSSRINVLVLTVPGSIGSLNVASILDVTGTPVAPSAGFTDRTCSGESLAVIV